MITFIEHYGIHYAIEDGAVIGCYRPLAQVTLAMPAAVWDFRMYARGVVSATVISPFAADTTMHDYLQPVVRKWLNASTREASLDEAGTRELQKQAAGVQLVARAAKAAGATVTSAQAI